MSKSVNITNNKSIALIVLFTENNKVEIKQAYIPQYNFNRENKITFLMIADGEKWHFLAANKSYNELHQKIMVIIFVLAQSTQIYRNNVVKIVI